MPANRWNEKAFLTEFLARNAIKGVAVNVEAIWAYFV
jgi:hypothetical protein